MIVAPARGAWGAQPPNKNGAGGRARDLAAALAVVALPGVVFAWLTSDPERNWHFMVPTGHLLVVTTVSLLAVGVAVLVARAALQLEEYKVFLISLGFLTMAGLFSVHALATPGILLHGPGIHATGVAVGAALNYDGTIIGLSAFLSIFCPSIFFALGYTPLPARLGRGRRLNGSWILLGALLVLGLYGTLSATAPSLMVEVLPASRPPFSVGLAAPSGLLLAFAAWRQAITYGETRLPSHASLTLAFLLLAEAQILVVVTPFWKLTWWEYHALMLIAVVTALGALFVELDRRRGLERFVGAEVVERLVAGGEHLAAEKRVLTILFADLRGSTALADKLPVSEVVEIINAYVSTVAQCVLRQGGMVDKFLGDGLMAIFGLRADPSEGASSAGLAILEIRKAMEALSQEREARGAATLDYGVAIHTGEVILGAVGLTERADFTAMGDTVNTASRLEGLCKEFGVNVVISEDSAGRLPRSTFSLRPLGEATVRGKQEPITVFTLD